jgi:hypothetical protein
LFCYSYFSSYPFFFYSLFFSSSYKDMGGSRKDKSGALGYKAMGGGEKTPRNGSTGPSRLTMSRLEQVRPS